MDCGPACLAMICKRYGRNYSLQYLRDNAFLTREGVSLLGLGEAASLIGLHSMPVRTSLDKLINEKPFPCVLFWNSGHFVILYNVKKSPLSQKFFFKIADPAVGLVTVPEDNFKESWVNEGQKGIAMLVEPSAKFYELEPPKAVNYDLKKVFRYLTPYKKNILQIFFGLMISSLFTLIAPFLTQSLIDKGVMAHNINFITIILLAQIFLFLGTVMIDIVRNWVLIYIGARVNISIISDFFKKIMRLPLHFFDTKLMGDFYQRIHDHTRIEQFLTSQSLTTLFSFINFFIFFFVLFYYDSKILLVYVVMTLIAIYWSRLFLKKRERLDYFRFRSNALNQESVNEMISGIQEIKLNNFENYKIDQWKNIQIKLFNVNIRVLRVDQFQLIGYEFINQLKNIIVTFLAAREVLLGHITVGGMLSIAYIIGQMNSPVSQLITFFRSLQDAQLSLKRLMEVQEIQEEEKETDFVINKSDLKAKPDPASGIQLSNVSFQYEGPKSPFVLKDINLLIPEGKKTAIVGSSGSGKTTLMKLLLRFYEPNMGKIEFNNKELAEISPLSWRENCGVVLQDGFIFSESINRNIATKDEEINDAYLRKAIKIANIEEFVDSLPLKGETKIGASGNGISGGQRQRILIARAVYKQPHFIFFDEATSSLDTESEKIIHDNLKEFFQHKTVVIIAHRLSTVKNADQIVVLKSGQIVEQGTHNELIDLRGDYFNLVRNQLDLEMS
ncbi:MAG: peptidase domain-containing ABC transporter [Bacteroidetes bacterium]|nr:peptidase domain-containing ABC transporter [Bacteroidota bacterium]